jgi:hypothetical protein
MALLDTTPGKIVLRYKFVFGTYLTKIYALIKVELGSLPVQEMPVVRFGWRPTAQLSSKRESLSSWYRVM